MAVASAMDAFNMGVLTPTTPFDWHIREAGGFNLLPPNPAPAEPHQSIQELFQIAHSFRYVRDGSNRNHWQSAEETEAKHAGDCKDKAIWLFAHLIHNGYYNVRLVVGKYREVDSQLHVWVICSDRQGNTCLLDPTIQKRIWYLTAIDSGLYHPLYAYDGQNRFRYNSPTR